MAATKATVASLDFTDVKDGGATFNKKRVPAGDYLAKVTAVVDAPTKENKEPQWLFTLELQEKFTDRKFPYYCKLQANQLWKVRNLFIAAGIAVPKKKVRVDPNKVVGKLVAITLDDDEYDGKMQSNVTEVFSANELDGSEVSDDEEEFEDGEDVDTEDDEEEDEDEATEEPEDDEEEEEDDEEEPEPAPAPKRRPAKKAAPSIPAQRKASPTRRTKPAPTEVDEDELEELDLEGI